MLDFIYRTLSVPLTLILKLLFRLKIHGRENVPEGRGLLLIARHRSYWDIPLMISALGGRHRIWFVAKHTLLNNLFFHIFVKYYGIPIDRDNFSRDDFRKIVDAMNQEKIVGIYPEGTTLQTDQIRIGVLRFAEKANKEFLPLRLDCVGPYPPKYPFGFPNVTAFIGKPFSLQDLEAELSGEESRRERYDQLAELMMERLDKTGFPKPRPQKEMLHITIFGL